MNSVKFCCLVCEVLVQTLTISKRWCCLSTTKISSAVFSLCNITNSSKVNVADPTWVQSTIATRMVCSPYFVFGSMVHMGTVNVGNNK